MAETLLMVRQKLCMSKTMNVPLITYTYLSNTCEILRIVWDTV